MIKKPKSPSKRDIAIAKMLRVITDEYSIFVDAHLAKSILSEAIAKVDSICYSINLNSVIECVEKREI